MYNQVMFQIWSWYHKNCGFCEILFGRSTKNNLWAEVESNELHLLALL